MKFVHFKLGRTEKGVAIKVTFLIRQETHVEDVFSAENYNQSHISSSLMQIFHLTVGILGAYISC